LFFLRRAGNGVALDADVAELAPATARGLVVVDSPVEDRECLAIAGESKLFREIGTQDFDFDGVGCDIRDAEYTLVAFAGQRREPGAFLFDGRPQIDRHEFFGCRILRAERLRQ
jgi:hypothetical protein